MASLSRNELTYVPILRELWGMPIDQVRPVLVSVGVKAYLLKGLPDLDHTVAEPGALLAWFFEGHLSGVYLLARTDEIPPATLAAIEHLRASDRLTSVLEEIRDELREMNGKRKLLAEEQERLSRMPKGDLMP